MLCYALFIDVLAQPKNFSLKIQKIDISIIDVVEAVGNTRQNYRQLLKHMEKDPASILKLPMPKLKIDNVEANEDGKPCCQNVKLKHFLHEKGCIVNHAVEIVKSIVECFDKCYGNVNVHVDEGDHLLLDVSQILNCNVWPDSTEILQHAPQLVALQKLFDCFKEMAIFNGVTSQDIK